MARPHGTPMLAAAALTALGALAGCQPSSDGRQMEIARAIGNPDRGEHLIRDHHCGSCHTIPGVRGAHGAVGPPLEFFSRRIYIAGEVPNTPGNLVRWVMNPQSIEPKTAMPALGLNERDARDVAAYLYTLQ
jgi:cytochrome c2